MLFLQTAGKTMRTIVYAIILTISFGVPQDNSAPQVPGWGIYIGGGLVGVWDVEQDTDVKMHSTLPNFGISKGLLLEDTPIIVGLGIHKRGFASGTQYDVDYEVIMNYLDFWVTIVKPVDQVNQDFLNIGVLIGTYVNGSVTAHEENVEVKVDLDEGPDGLDLALMIGIGLPLTVIDNGFALMCGGYLGFADHDGFKFNGLYLNLGYNFN